MSIPRFKMLVITLLLILFSIIETNAFFSDYSKKLDSIQLIYNKDEIRLPGQKFTIGIIAYYKNGKIKKTRNLDGGTLIWDFFKIEVSGGSHFAGKVKVSDKLYPSKGKYISIKAWPGKGTQMTKELLLPLNYESEIEIVPTSNIVKAPGFRFNFKILAKFDNGDIKEYTFKKRDMLKSKYFLFATNGGEVFKNHFQINYDFRSISDHKVFITAISKRNPDCIHDFTLNLDYKADYNLFLKGWNGSSGSSGFSGSSGSEGCNGGDGQCGGDGEDGQQGPDVGIWVDLYFDSKINSNLMYIYAENLNTGQDYRYLLNPDGGTFHIVSAGGDGGSGGSGGSGGNGGNGRDGDLHSKEEQVNDSTIVVKTWRDPGGNGGNGGNGGCGGYGGNGGRGGNIYVYFTEDAIAYKDLIFPSTQGGYGGSAGSGGFGGSGGSGGSGSPNGSSGRSGWNGQGGWSGSYGWGGEIKYDTTEDIVNLNDE